MRAVAKYSLQLWATIVLHSWFASWNSTTKRFGGNNGGKTNLSQFVIFQENERKQWKRLQPIIIRKCRRDPLPLPWENWYETVKSLQAGKIWPFLPKLVWCKSPVYVFHLTICWKAWSDWFQRLFCHRLRWICEMVGEQLWNCARAKHFPRSILHQRYPSKMVPWEKYHHRRYPKVRPKTFSKGDEEASWQGREKHCVLLLRGWKMRFATPRMRKQCCYCMLTRRRKGRK